VASLVDVRGCLGNADVRGLAVAAICRVALVTLSGSHGQLRNIPRQEVGQTSISSDGPELLAPSDKGSSTTSAVSSGRSFGKAMARKVQAGVERETRTGTSTNRELCIFHGNYI
jgi:hypothetical protein